MELPDEMVNEMAMQNIQVSGQVSPNNKTTKFAKSLQQSLGKKISKQKAINEYKR